MNKICIHLQPRINCINTILINCIIVQYIIFFLVIVWKQRNPSDKLPFNVLMSRLALYSVVRLGLCLHCIGRRRAFRRCKLMAVLDIQCCRFMSVCGTQTDLGYGHSGWRREWKAKCGLMCHTLHNSPSQSLAPAVQSIKAALGSVQIVSLELIDSDLVWYPWIWLCFTFYSHGCFRDI